MAIGRVSLNPKETVLMSAVILVLFFVYDHFWMSKKKLESYRIDETLVTTRSELERRREMVSHLANQGPAIGSSPSSRELLGKYMKSNAKFSSVISAITSEEPKNPYILNRILADGHTQVDGYSQTLYDIELEATFISVGKFLERLEDSPLLTEVQSIEIARVENEMKRCKTHIRLYSYVAKE